jgi:hypothetical protein
MSDELNISLQMPCGYLTPWQRSKEAAMHTAAAQQARWENTVAREPSKGRSNYLATDGATAQKTCASELGTQNALSMETYPILIN